MKRNDWILLIGTFLYSYLFYEQYAGINFLIFSIFLVGALLLKNKDYWRNLNWSVAAGGALLSSFFVAWHSSPLAIIANFISLALLSGLSLSARSSVLMSLFHTLCAAGSSYVFMFLDWAERRKQKRTEKAGRPVYVTILIILITFFIALLFFLMYRSANPLFDDFTKYINLDFISIPWIAFTLGGLVLLYGFFYNRRLGILTEKDENANDHLAEEKANAPGIFGKLFRIETEYLSGTSLLAVLNIMLLTLNLLDLYYLWFDGTLPEGINHKEFVHKGVGMLITSIVSAILIILFYFRGSLNYYPNKRWLVWLACFWIAQNAFMIFSTAYRNNMYIAESGLSYKKIGVYVYLLLTLSGLITTWIKITKTRSNWFLFRKNAWAFYSILVISCTVNWDVLITNFNIRKASEPHKQLEKYFLADLSFKNLPQLLMLPDTVQSYNDYEAREYYYSSRGVYFHDFKSGLHNKLYRFMREMENPGWQSWCYEKERVKAELLQMDKEGKIKELSLNNNYGMHTLSPIFEFGNVQVMDLSNVYLKNLGEFSHFPKLEQLRITNAGIDSLDKLPQMKALKQLSIGSNQIKNLAPLAQAPVLENLDISNMQLRSIYTLPKMEKLKFLNLSTNPVEDFSRLSGFSSLETLLISNTFGGRLDSIPAIPSLKWLDVSGNSITPGIVSDFMGKIRNFQNLEYLNMGNNTIENLYCLTQLYPQSYYLNNWTMDKSKGILLPLFPKLKELDINNTNLISLQGIECYSNLEKLNAGSANLKSLDAICGLKNLKELKIYNSPSANTEVLGCLTNLEELVLYGCQVKRDAAFLAPLKNLQRLDLSSNSVRSLEAIYGLSNLTTLNLSNNNLENIKGIEKLQKLEMLWLTNNSITDFKPLYALKNLKEVYIDDISRKDLEALKKALPDCRVSSRYQWEQQAAEAVSDISR